MGEGEPRRKGKETTAHDWNDLTNQKERHKQGRNATKPKNQSQNHPIKSVPKGRQ